MRTVTRAAITISLPFIVAILSPGICVAQNAYTSTNPRDLVYWPNRGYFPAYNIEQDTRPISFFAGATLFVDDNLFRLSDETPATALGSNSRGDTYARLGVGTTGSVDFSRQQLRFDANADHYSYNHFSFLNTWVYSADANLLWTVGSALHGEAGYAQDLSLPNFAELQTISTDKLKHQYAHFSANWRTAPRLELRALVEGSRYEHDDITLNYLNNTVGSATGGLFYVSPGQTGIGVQYKESHGDYPNPQPIPNPPRGTLLVNNNYRESETSGVITKDFDTRIGATIRLGYTHREHEQFPERDFQGGTGRGQLRYAPTAKILLELSAYRDLEEVQDLSASYALVRGASFGPAWAPTSKTVVQASYIYEDRSFLGNPGVLLTVQPLREDLSRIGRLAAGYRPGPHFQVALAYEHGRRTADLPGIDYEYNQGSLDITGTF